jgi:hypothetical protein
MTTLQSQVLALLAPLAGLFALAAGCSAGGSAGSYNGGFGGGVSGYGGNIMVGVADAAVGPRDSSLQSDAVKSEVLSNLSADAPTFKWDACVGCSAGSLGGSSGAGGGVSGNDGGTSAAGAMGSGGSAAGGATGRGGSTGTGGSKADAGLPDAPVTPDAGAFDVRPSPDSASTGRDSAADTIASADAGVADLRPADSFSPDTTSPCVATIEGVVPATDAFKDYHLVAGPNAKVVLRASIVSGGPATGAGWTWQAYRDGTPVSYAAGTQDPAAAAFSISTAGTYSFTATSGTCLATVQNTVDAATICPDCGHYLNLRFAPPPSTSIPVQSGAYKLTGSSPFSQAALVISRGVAVQVAPSVGSGLIPSYVRINSSGGDLVADGLSNPKTGGFGAQLLDASYAGALLKYDVLVVPVDDSSSNGGTVGATAPQLFLNLTPSAINNTTFNLAGGVSVTGTTVSSTGQAVADVRVMLTNQDPADTQPSKLIFSSVGSSDVQGKYLLHVQPGKYWISLSPPTGSGLPEALVPSSVTLAGDATLDFKWDPITTSTLVLNVVDAAGSPSVGTRVRLTSAEAQPVGTLTSAGGAVATSTANGNVQVESVTSATGVATFANLPDGANYDALLVPATLGPYAATTTVSLALPTGGATLPVGLLAQGRISGQLTASSVSSAIDWTRVEVIAYDRSNDTPEVPMAVTAQTNGTFSIGVSPGRSYAVMVVPDASTGLARTFVGPGPLQASEFSLTQNVQASMVWASTVMDGSQNGLPNTAMQVFCIADWPYCVDPTIPLAETTSGDSGAFQFALPDPATR